MQKIIHQKLKKMEKVNRTKEEIEEQLHKLEEEREKLLRERQQVDPNAYNSKETFYN